LAWFSPPTGGECPFFSRVIVENLDLKFEDVSVSTFEREIAAERFPNGGFLFNVTPGKRYTKDVIRYHIPCEGEEALLRCVPSSRIRWTTEVIIERGCVCFDVVSFYDNAEAIKQKAESTIDRIKKQLANVRNQVAAYNSALQGDAARIFQSRKQHLLKKNDLMASLGVPIKKRSDLSRTFAIPTPKTRKKIQVSKPQVVQKGFKPEPTLEQSTYEEILRIAYDWGKQFERMPSTYTGKSEEDLRDLFLVFLEPYFEGTTTGETFNKAGKTDILLRHEGSNVFIAECKFWRGKKSLLEALAQLISYLTWRDSKAAVVVFVQNKDFSSVLKTLEDTISEHSNYLGFIGKTEESWFNYRFHINGDSNREVKLAVLLFHFP